MGWLFTPASMNILEQDCISEALWFQCNNTNLALDMQYNVDFWSIQHFDASKLILVAYDVLSYFMCFIVPEVAEQNFVNSIHYWLTGG